MSDKKLRKVAEMLSLLLLLSRFVLTVYMSMFPFTEGWLHAQNTCMASQPYRITSCVIMVKTSLTNPPKPLLNFFKPTFPITDPEVPVSSMNQY